MENSICWGKSEINNTLVAQYQKLALRKTLTSCSRIFLGNVLSCFKLTTLAVMVLLVDIAYLGIFSQNAMACTKLTKQPRYWCMYEICFYSCLLSYYMLINVDYTITYFLPIPSTVPRTRARSELLNVSLVPPRVEFYTALPVSIVGRY